jgi:hypothetical protein
MDRFISQLSERGEAIRRGLREWLRNGGTTEEFKHNLRADNPHLSAEIIDSLFFAADWYDCGLPRIAMSHRLAATLMLTRVPREIAGALTLPWQTFVVDVPSGLLMSGSLHDRRPITRLLVTRPGATSRLHIIEVSDTAIGAAIKGFTLADADDLPEDVRFEGTEWPEIHARRYIQTTLRLVLGAVLEMDTYRPTGPRMPRIDDVTVRRTPRGAPEPRTFVLTRTVRLDTRATLREYLTGTGRGTSVQTLVRGHWKMQPCGVGRTERKYIHVEPYWRGPEDGPVVSHRYVLPDDAERRRD